MVVRSALVTLCVMLSAGACAQPVAVSRDEAAAWVRYVVPLPKTIEIPRKVIVESASVSVVPPAGNDPVVTQACKELHRSLGLPEAAPTPSGPRFTVTLQLGGPEAERLRSLKNADQAYAIAAGKGNASLTLVALSPRGLYYAAKTLQQLIAARLKDGKVEMPLLAVTDWPDMQDRGLWGSDSYLWLKWMADRKLNFNEQIAARSVDPATKRATAGLKPGREPLIDEGPLYGITPSPAVLHLEQHARTGIFEAYPSLRGVGGQENTMCYSRPEVVDVLADWIADLKSLPHVPDVSVWMTENLHGKGGCQCADCSEQQRDVQEARVIVAAWRKAQQKLGKQFGLRILTSEETRDGNAQVFADIPREVKVWYYDSLFTYTTGRSPMISPEVAAVAKEGRYVGVTPNLCGYVNLTHPFTSPQFAHGRMSEFVEKGLAGLTGYANPTMAYTRFLVEGAAEWSWNAKGRTPREFALSWTVREGLKHPEKFADWTETLGNVTWDLYGSDWPDGETRRYPGPIANHLRAGTLPPLGTVKGAFRGPWGEFRTARQLRDDAIAAARAVALSRDMGIPEFYYESLVADGYMKSLNALYALKALVKSGQVAPADRHVTSLLFGEYVAGLKQASRALVKWDTCLTGKSEFVEKPVKVLNTAIDGMKKLAADVGCELD